VAAVNHVGVSYNADLKAIAEDIETRQRERFRRQTATQLEAEKQHREAFSRPLISNDLLTEEERNETRKKIATSGQLTWRMRGEWSPRRA
jgi:hypothetical protein